MARGFLVAAALLLALVATAAWVAAATYLLYERSGLLDTSLLSLEEVAGGLFLFALLPVLAWVLVVIVLRSPIDRERLARIEDLVGEQAAIALDEAADVRALTSAVESTRSELEATASLAGAERAALVQVAEPLGELAGRLQQTLAALDAAEVPPKPRPGQRAETGRVDFLVTATSIMAKLNESVGDLHAMMKVEITPDLRAAIAAGDETALARRLPRLKDPSGTRGIALRYARDAAFRAQADSYMEAFEGLLADARAADPASGLAGLFATSDLGRLYLVLARDTGRRLPEAAKAPLQ
ncbi:MAG: hypothetical protein AAFY02_18390 [Pseudomonadota bacterium]